MVERYPNRKAGTVPDLASSTDPTIPAPVLPVHPGGRMSTGNDLPIALPRGLTPVPIQALSPMSANRHPRTAEHDCTAGTESCWTRYMPRSLDNP